MPRKHKPARLHLFSYGRNLLSRRLNKEIFTWTQLLKSRSLSLGHLGLVKRSTGAACRMGVSFYQPRMVEA